MRRVLVCLFMLLLVGAAWTVEAASAVEKEKLVGQWVPKQVPDRLANMFARSFEKNNKYWQGDSSPTGLKLYGTFKLEGDKLTTKFNDVPGVPGEVKQYTIKSLTDTELTLLEGKRAETFRRAK